MADKFRIPLEAACGKQPGSDSRDSQRLE